MILLSKWIDRDVLLHLRLPFSIYLFPIFCFALSQATDITLFNTIIIFLVLHFFIYPASNIYNSYMDKDEESIGALEVPPPVTKKMFYASIVFDSLGLILSVLISFKFTIVIAFYILVSKVYSWHSIRLKKYPFISWLTVVLFQGGYTFMLVNCFSTNGLLINWFDNKNIYAFCISCFLVGAIYPITQIYQHNEDKKRGDKTISLVLGVRGTFLFSASLFILSLTCFYFYFQTFYSTLHYILLLIFLSPVLIYFVWWFLKVLKNSKEANFKRTMMLNKISALCMITCFLILFYLNN